MAGERAYPRARNLLSQSLAIGARLQDPRIIGGTHALDAMCGWLTGRWDLARDRGKEAERILRENCAGAWWELSVARNALLGGLLWGGQWNEYASRLAEFSDDARTRNDLSSLAMYRMNHGAVSLARNDVGQADRDLLEAQRILADAWSTRGFHIPHFFGLFCRGQVAIYSGNRSAAMDLLTRELPAMRTSYLLRVETIAILALLLEGMLAIACAAGPVAPGKDSSRSRSQSPTLRRSHSTEAGHLGIRSRHVNRGGCGCRAGPVGFGVRAMVGCRARTEPGRHAHVCRSCALLAGAHHGRSGTDRRGRGILPQ